MSARDGRRPFAKGSSRFGKSAGSHGVLTYSPRRNRQGSGAAGVMATSRAFSELGRAMSRTVSGRKTGALLWSKQLIGGRAIQALHNVPSRMSDL
jgi:hypothetical protein